MELYKEIIAKILEKEDVNINFPNLQITAKEIVKTECYKALQEIKDIIEDNTLTDKECFMKIEDIVGVFERFGSDGGNRHDF